MHLISAITLSLAAVMASASPLMERAAPSNCVSSSMLPAMSGWVKSAPSCAINAIIDVVGNDAQWDQSCTCWDKNKQQQIACALKSRCASSTQDALNFQTMVGSMCGNKGGRYVSTPVPNGYLTKTYTAFAQITGC